MSKTVMTKRHVLIANKCFWAGIFLLASSIHAVLPEFPDGVSGFIAGTANAMFWWSEP